MGINLFETLLNHSTEMKVHKSRHILIWLMKLPFLRVEAQYIEALFASQKLLFCLFHFRAYNFKNAVFVVANY